MNFSFVSNKRLKIILNKKDMSDYKINFTTLNYSTGENKAIFWELISIAKRTVGFDTYGYKILIEAFPNDDGGASIYITKLALKRQTAPQSVTCHDGKYILKFKRTDDLIDCSHILKKEKKYIKNYFYYDSSYYIETDLSTVEKENRRKWVLNMLEYADCIIDYKFISYLNEYGKDITVNHSL